MKIRLINSSKKYKFLNANGYCSNRNSSNIFLHLKFSFYSCYCKDMHLVYMVMSRLQLNPLISDSSDRSVLFNNRRWRRVWLTFRSRSGAKNGASSKFNGALEQCTSCNQSCWFVGGSAATAANLEDTAVASSSHKLVWKQFDDGKWGWGYSAPTVLSTTQEQISKESLLICKNYVQEKDSFLKCYFS